MDFEEIAKTCPLRSEFNCCEATHGSYGLCNKKNCAFWHWMYHRSVIPVKSVGVRAFDKEEVDATSI